MDFQGPLYDVRMRRGQGYNSYIQEPRVDDAVEFKPRAQQSDSTTLTLKDAPSDVATADTATTSDGNVAAPNTSQSPPNWNDFFPALLKYMSKGDAPAAKSHDDKVLPYLRPSPSSTANQTVLFSSKQVKKVSEISDAMGFKASAAVKTGTIGPGAEIGSNLASSGDFNSNTLNFLVHVKVVNEKDDKDENWNFNPVEGLAERLKNIKGVTEEDSAHKRAIEFTRIYGDTFISDFVEGGEIYALVGIKSRTTANMNDLRAYASAQLTPVAVPVQVKAETDFTKKGKEAFEQAETSIRVQWRGGGEIKTHDFQWGLDSLIQIANAFPSFVATTYARIRAVLTPYSAVKDFQKFQLQFPQAPLTLSYDHCALFVDTLYEDYKAFHDMWETLSDIVASPENYRVNEERGSKKGNDKTQPLRSQSERKEPARTSKENLASDSTAAMDPPQSPVNVPSSTSQMQQAPTITTTFKRSGTMLLAQENVSSTKAEPGGSDFLLNDLTNILNEKDDPKLEPVDPKNTQQLGKLRLICRSSMLYIQEIAAQLVIDPTKTETTSGKGMDGIPKFVQPHYPYPGTLRKVLPVSTGRKTGGPQYSYNHYTEIDDFQIPTSMKDYDNRPNDYMYYWDVLGDTLSSYKDYEHFQIGNFSYSNAQFPQAIAFQKNPSSLLGYVDRRVREDANIISGIAFRYNEPLSDDFSDLQNQVLDDGTTKSTKGKSGGLYTVSVGKPPVSEKDWVPVLDMGDDPPIGELIIYNTLGSGRIAGLSFLKPFDEDENSSEADRVIISHKSWEGRWRKPSPIPSSTPLSPGDGVTDAQFWMFAGFFGAFEKIGPLKRDRALAKIAVIWKRIPQSDDDY